MYCDPMKILVTGGTGFIGGRTVGALLSQGGNEVSFTGRTPPKQTTLVDRGAKFLPGDLTDETYVKRVTQNIEAIVHCAGLAGTWGTRDEFYRGNVLPTRLLLESAKTNGVRRFVNISSPSIYFDFKDQLNLKEGDLPKKFSNEYAKTKYEAEELVKAYHSKNLLTVSLRPRSVIGAGDQNVLPRLIRLQKTGNLVQIGAGRNVVDITTIGNLIDGIFLCLKAPEAAMGEVYNITNGAPIRFWDFVDEVLKTGGQSLKRRRIPYLPVMAAAMINEKMSKVLGRKKEPALLPISVGIISFSMTLDISKAKKNLNYMPRFTTQDGIHEFFARN